MTAPAPPERAATPMAAQGSAPPVADPAGATSPPGGAPAQTSPQQGHGRVAAGMAGPETGASSPFAAPVRARPETPAGAGRRRAKPAVPAGSTAIAAAMSEDRGPDSLDAHVRKLMKDLGLTGFHVEKSLDVDKNRKNVSVKGWPDWTIRGARGVLVRELKSQRGRVEPEQREWLDALAAAGNDVDVWRPSDLLSGRIARELAAISKVVAAPDGAA